MGKPYSLDLRKRAVAAVLVGGMSRNQAAKHFGVGISTAINWVKRQQETGSVAPGQMGGHRPRRFRASTGCGSCNGPSVETSRYAASWPSWLSVG